MSQMGNRRSNRRIEETLVANELRFRSLFESTQNAILLLDAEIGEIIEVNQAFEKLLGYPRAELIGMKFGESNFFQDDETGRTIYHELRKKNAIHYKDLSVVTKLGQIRSVEFNSITYDLDHRQLMQCDLHDVTEWRKKADELGKIARIPAENPNPVFRLDLDGNILFANKATQKFLDEWGIPKGGKVPKFWQDVLSKALKKQKTDVVESQFEARTFSFFVAPIPGENYVNLYGFDVTSLKQEEEARRIAEANYRALVEQIPAITYIDRANGGAISLFVSPQVKTILGVTQEEWMQGDISFWARMIHIHDRERVVSAYQNTIATGEPFGEEYRMTARDGREVWIDDHAVLLRDSEGRPKTLHGVMFDITERKHAQALQEAVYRIAIATETTESLSDLFSQIHEIIASVMPAENFYITLYDEGKNTLHFPYFRDALDEPYLGEIEPGKGLTAYVLRTGKSLLCTQAVHDELERRGAVILVGVPSAIWLGVPLIIEGKTIGAMVVQHYSDPEAYSEREQHVLEFVSSQVAFAISRKQVEEKLRQLSTHDILTGLFNRGYFETELERLERSRQYPVSIVMADVDQLKETNDKDGHAAGDMLLKRLALVLSAAFRSEDLVARIGGDEFAVILPNTNASEAMNALKRVRIMLQEHNADHTGTQLQVSFGASTAEKSGALADVLKEADANMYADKRANFMPAKNRSGRKSRRNKTTVMQSP